MTDDTKRANGPRMVPLEEVEAAVWGAYDVDPSLPEYELTGIGVQLRYQAEAVVEKLRARFGQPEAE